MKQTLITLMALLFMGSAIAGVADYHLSKVDKAFVERGGKLKGCDALVYDGGIVCVKTNR